MNIFVGIGKLIEVKVSGKLMKFCIALQQDKPCIVPCVLFSPTAQFVKTIEELSESGKPVWLQGRMSSYELEFEGKFSRKIEVVTFPSCIRQIAP